MPTAVKTLKKKSVLSIKPKRKINNPTDQDFQEMISQAAYYKAEQRGFVPGFEEEDWLLAEEEIIAMQKRH